MATGTDIVQPGGMPPEAQRKAAALQAEIAAWLRSSPGKDPPVVRLEGQEGSGKSSVLAVLAQVLGRDGAPVLHLVPPDLDLDSPAGLLVQGAGRLREAGINGVLDPVFASAYDLETKGAKVVAGLERFAPGAVLVDIPASWSAATTPDYLESQRRARHLIEQLLAGASTRHATVFAVSEGQAVDAPEGVRTEHLGLAASEEIWTPERWGKLGHSVERLRGALSDAAPRLSPLEIRLAVTLVYLGFSLAGVKEACAGGLMELRRLFFEELGRHPALGRAFEKLTLARFPLPREVLDALVAAEPPGDDAPDPDLIAALLLESPEGSYVHPSLRGWRSDDEGRGEHREAHAWLAQAWEGIAAGAGVALRAVARFEALHHAAAAGRVEALSGELPDASLLSTLGRSLSRAQRFEEAVAVYRRALALRPDDSYVLEYLAYNLERTGQAPEEAEALFARAVELEPGNPWWNQRLVTALLRRGKLRAAREAWLKALRQIGSSDAEWLARNFHYPIARALLDRAELAMAREVLGTLPPRVRANDLLVLQLENSLEHRAQAERLGAAVFPEELPFSTRWAGPHYAAPDETEGRRAWYPGQVASLSAGRVVLRLAEPPAPGGAPRVFTSELEEQPFLEAAGLRSLERVREGQFLEVVVQADGATRIYLRGRPADKLLRDPLDLIRSWRPDAGASEPA